MADQTITITLSESAIRRLQRAAELTDRSIDEVLSNTIDAALPASPNLPPEVADEIAAMYLFSDSALWAAAQPSLTPPEQRRLQQLNQAAGEASLGEVEAAEQIALINAYHRSVLRRAQALAVLALRGHPIQPEVA